MSFGWNRSTYPETEEEAALYLQAALNYLHAFHGGTWAAMILAQKLAETAGVRGDLMSEEEIRISVTVPNPSAVGGKLAAQILDGGPYDTETLRKRISNLITEFLLALSEVKAVEKKA